MSEEHTCETCIHEDDSSPEYCGSCDLVDQWSLRPDVAIENACKNCPLKAENEKLRKSMQTFVDHYKAADYDIVTELAVAAGTVKRFETELAAPQVLKEKPDGQ